MGNKTKELCEFLVNLTYEDLGETNIQDLRYKTLDWLGCLIAAQNLPTVVSARSVILEQGGNEQATLIGSKDKTSVINAAFGNGIACHALEYDDTNKIGITHPGAPVIAAALAVSESLHCDFEKFALAVAVGYETMIRLGGALNPQHYNSWHTTGTCGTFAAAAATGVLLGFNAEQMERSFGIAATMASGLVGVFGTDAKLVTVGNAAKNGVLAAMLVQKGLTAPQDIIACSNGYAKATSSNQDLSFMVPKFGDALLMEDAYYKIHASCGHTHSALDALQSILQTQSIVLQDIKSVTVDVYKIAYCLCANFENETALKAKFSLPYCLSVLLKYGKCTLSEFSEDTLNSSEIKSIADKIQVKENDKYTEAYPKLRLSKVTVTLFNGQEIEKIVDLPLGKPPYSFVEMKYFSLVEMAITTDLAQEIKQTVLTMNKQSKMTCLGDLLRKTEENIIFKI